MLFYSMATGVLSGCLPPFEEFPEPRAIVCILLIMVAQKCNPYTKAANGIADRHLSEVMVTPR